MIFSDQNLARQIERAEARSNAAFVEERAKMYPASDACWTQIAGVYAMFDGAESPLTQTFGLGVFDEITNAEMERLEAFFAKHDAPVFHDVSPLANASILPLLNSRGYQPIELTSVLYQEIKPRNTVHLEVNPNINTRITKPGKEKIWGMTSARDWS